MITCIHSDFRVGGLKAGETKEIRGKIYIIDADVPALVQHANKTFPNTQSRKIEQEQTENAKTNRSGAVE